jgi:hypothetical protein
MNTPIHPIGNANLGAASKSHACAPNYVPIKRASCPTEPERKHLALFKTTVMKGRRD